MAASALTKVGWSLSQATACLEGCIVAGALLDDNTHRSTA
jgi:hypothetical protein